MTTLTAKDAQNHFGDLVNLAQQEPVAITRHRRKVMVVLSAQEYQRLQDMENAYWAMRADQAYEHAEWLTPSETETAIKELLEDA